MLTSVTPFRVLVFIILLFAAVIKPVAAQDVIQPGTLLLTGKYHEHFLSPYLYTYDMENVQDLQKLTTAKGEKLFQGAAQSIIKVPHDKDDVWYSLNIFNRSWTTEWVFDFGFSTTGRFGYANAISAFVYDPESNTLQASRINPETGQLTMDIEQEKRLRVFINIDGPEASPIMFPLKIKKSSLVPGFKSFILIYILFVFLIAMAFFYAAMAYVHSNFEHLYFMAYYLSLCLILLVQNSYVTFNYFFIGAGIQPFLYLLVALSALFTARKFWEINTRSAIIKSIFNLLIIASFISLGIASILSLGSDLEFILSYGPTLLILCVIPIISIFLSRQGQEENTPFMFGWFILLFGIAISILPFTDMMPPVSSAINAYWFAIIPQAVFFMIATKMYVSITQNEMMEPKTVEIKESQSVSKLRESREQIEQQRLLKVIEQERKVLSELRKGEARRTEEMRRAKEEADEANRAKSAFLAVVTHEIRTPMTGIMGMVKLLLESNLSKDQNKYAQTIQDSGDAMLALLNDILDFEKIEQGKMSFEKINFDLHRLINGVSTLMNGHAVQKQITLNTKLGPNVPRFVKGDPTRLRQVLLNLTGNAIKFTDQGEVTITAELINKEYEEDTALCELYFSVTDSGIGISEEAQKNLFNPFAQADSSISRKFGGTGLGLAISNGLVKAMGSEIHINSKEGEGSTFFFTVKLPLGHGDMIGDSVNETRTESKPTQKDSTPTVQKTDAPAPSKTKATQSVINKQDLKILVVDDNFINQQVIQEFFKKEKLEVDSANSAEKALEMIKNNKYDVVLMDIEMPGMNGDEATRIIRRTNNPNHENLKIIALTGNLMPDHVTQYKKAGMDDVLGKPIDPEQLFTVVYAAKSRNTSPPAPPPSNRSDKKATIGVLDLETLSTLKGHLKNEDIQSMLNDVIVKNKEIIDNMQAEMKASNLEGVYARAHELKGMAGNFGLAELSQQAAIVEKKAKTGPSIMVASEINALEEKRKSAEAALNQWINENLKD